MDKTLPIINKKKGYAAVRGRMVGDARVRYETGERQEADARGSGEEEGDAQSPVSSQVREKCP